MAGLAVALCGLAYGAVAALVFGMAAIELGARRRPLPGRVAGIAVAAFLWPVAVAVVAAMAGIDRARRRPAVRRSPA